jgi:sugar lactone lactonase YvrE
LAKSERKLKGGEKLSSVSVEVVVDARATIGEGPVWDARENVVWWVDITRNLVHRYDPGSGHDSTIDIGQAVGAVVPRASGGLALAVQDGFAVLDPETRRLDLIAPVEKDQPENRMNDAKCDTSGRLWGGTMAYSEAAGAGAFYRLDTDHSVVRILDHITCSNGIGWSPDDRVMYYIDSGAQQVDVFDYERATGNVRNRRKLISIAADDGVPDGIAVDALGYIWVALWGGAAIRRFAPDGSLDKVLEIPAKQVTSCVFAGRDLTDLYITSACEGLAESELKAYPHSGALFVYHPAVAGQPTNSYGG